MKPVVDTESGSNNGDVVTGIRAARPDSTQITVNDPPTEEIDLAEAEAAAEAEASAPVVPLPVQGPPPLPPPLLERKASTPPPLPSAALRARLPTPPAAASLGLSPLGQLLPPAKPNGGTGRPSVPSVRAPVAIVGSEEALAELERVTKRMRERDAYLAEIEAAYAQRQEALLKAEAEIEKLRTQLTVKEARLADLEQQLRERSSAPPAARPSQPPSAAQQRPSQPVGPQSSNDLTRIKGIGPGYARALYALGISSFAKIAAWTPEDVASYGKKLKTPAGRIERDRWIEQARELIAADKA